MKSFQLLKEAVQRNDPSSQVKVEHLVAQLNKDLRGKEVKAFPKSFVADNLDTKAKEIRGTQTFKISSVRSPYNDPDTGNKDTFISLDIVLKGYNAEVYGLIYTDSIFLRSLKDLIKQTSVASLIKDIHYSEHGMQGDDYVNLDVMAGVS